IHVVRAGIELAGTGILHQVADESLGRRHRNILVDAECLLVFFHVGNVFNHVFGDDALDSVEKDSIAPADDSPVDRSKCKTEARAEIFLVHGKDRAWKFDAGASPAWRLLQALQRKELRRAFGVASGTALRID